MNAATANADRLPAATRALLRASCAECGRAGACLPASLAPDDVERVDRLVATKQQFERGEAIYAQGARAKSLYVVRSGAFRVDATSDEGQVRILAFALPGQLLGLDAMSLDRHQSSAVALERSSVCEVPYGRALEIAQSVPGLQKQLLRLVWREVQDDRTHLADFGRAPAPVRLARFLHALSLRYRALNRDASHLKLPMSRAELANYLGLALETVSRLMTRLEESGAVAVRARNVRILDAAALERACRVPGADEAPAA
jgi:CRP/FNR family transcriptional regulator